MKSSSFRRRFPRWAISFKRAMLTLRSRRFPSIPRSQHAASSPRRRHRGGRALPAPTPSTPQSHLCGQLRESLCENSPEAVAAWRKSLTEATDFLDANEAEARALMEAWLKIPAKVIAGSPLPDWNVAITAQELAPYVAISKAVGSIRTDPDVNSLVWQGP